MLYIWHLNIYNAKIHLLLVSLPQLLCLKYILGKDWHSEGLWFIKVVNWFKHSTINLFFQRMFLSPTLGPFFQHICVPCGRNPRVSRERRGCVLRAGILHTWFKQNFDLQSKVLMCVALRNKCSFFHKAIRTRLWVLCSSLFPWRKFHNCWFTNLL